MNRERGGTKGQTKVQSGETLEGIFKQITRHQWEGWNEIDGEKELGWGDTKKVMFVRGGR